jgi:hypothetical protein
MRELAAMTPRARLLAAALLVLPLAACGGNLGTPPVEILYRDSLLGQGLIIQVKNTSNEALSDVQVEVRGPDGERRTYTEDSLDGYEVLEVGWKRLGGWQVPKGAKVQVKAKGYLFPAQAEIDE